MSPLEENIVKSAQQALNELRSALTNLDTLDSFKKLAREIDAPWETVLRSEMSQRLSQITTLASLAKVTNNGMLDKTITLLLDIEKQSNNLIQLSLLWMKKPPVISNNSGINARIDDYVSGIVHEAWDIFSACHRAELDEKGKKENLPSGKDYLLKMLVNNRDLLDDYRIMIDLKDQLKSSE